MKIAIALSALVAAVLAAPAPETTGACPSATAVCLWDVKGQTTEITPGQSITFNGVKIACGTTQQINFGVGAKCKLQKGQAGTCDLSSGGTGKLKCTYKESGESNYTCDSN